MFACLKKPIAQRKTFASQESGLSVFLAKIGVQHKAELEKQ